MLACLLFVAVALAEPAEPPPAEPAEAPPEEPGWTEHGAYPLQPGVDPAALPSPLWTDHGQYVPVPTFEYRRRPVVRALALGFGVLGTSLTVFAVGAYAVDSVSDDAHGPRTWEP